MWPVGVRILRTILATRIGRLGRLLGVAGLANEVVPPAMLEEEVELVLMADDGVAPVS